MRCSTQQCGSPHFAIKHPFQFSCAPGESFSPSDSVRNSAVRRFHNGPGKATVRRADDVVKIARRFLLQCKNRPLPGEKSAHVGSVRKTLSCAGCRHGFLSFDLCPHMRAWLQAPLICRMHFAREARLTYYV